MRKLFLISLILLFSISGFAQKNNSGSAKISSTSFIAEAGGPGIAFSANIDKRFTNSHLGFGGRIGLGFVSAEEYRYDSVYSYDYNQTSALTFPVQLN